ncbi:MAG: hypothetical protein WC753_01330 [Candidatus Gracilibacteria bacterium]
MHTPGDAPEKNTFELETISAITQGHQSINRREDRVAITLSFGLFGRQRLSPRLFSFASDLPSDQLPPFSYNKPTRDSEFVASVDEVERNKDERSGYKALAVLVAPEDRGIMRPGHFYGTGASHALVATGDEGKSFRYFPFDCLDKEFIENELRDVPKFEVPRHIL